MTSELETMRSEADGQDAKQESIIIVNHDSDCPNGPHY